MTIQETADLLRVQNDVLILTHRRPDGDTVGCAAGLCRALRALGKRAWVLYNPDTTALFTPYLEGLIAPEGAEPAFVVSVDIAGRGLFPQVEERWLARGIDLAIDHHPSYEGFARESCVDAARAACGEIVFEIAQALGPVTADIALPLYVAVATDTGCFMYGNTSPASHRTAAALMETGIDYQAVNKRHFRTKSLRRLQLESGIIAGMELHNGGKLAIASVSLARMAELGATEEDADDIAAFVGQVEGVESSVTIRELRDGGCKLSVRTVGGLNATKVCACLGGGGHAAAAGCTVPGTIEEAKAAILEAIRAVEQK